MSERKTSIFIPMGSMTSIYKPAQTESEVSNLSFKHWHRLMQSEHERLERLGESSSFRLWKCCNKSCVPCRWFDSIEYEKKICKCCLKFKTFKTLGTILLIAVFFYIFLYSLLKDEVLPGGTLFFLLVLFLAAYITGYLIMLVGIPPMIGHLTVGIIFGNVPPHFLPQRDQETVETATKVSEKILFIIALIRAGLLLDLTQINNRLQFILRLALFPFCFEFILVWVSTHFLLKLPWDWGALQGSVMGIVSLASVTSIMEKNRMNGYGEDKNLSTVLIAASAFNVVFGLITYTLCISLIFPEDENHGKVWQIVLNILKHIMIGLAVGLVAGILVSFFPDKRNSEAAALRIIMIGIGSFAIGSILYTFNMPAGTVIGCLTMCLVCANMWDALGWHRETNPVQYFYTMAYYLAQPVVLSLLGYSINFKHSNGRDIAMSLIVLLIGLSGRLLVCFLVFAGKIYPTTTKEKTFICIAWISKGTFQAILAFGITYLININHHYQAQSDVDAMFHYAKLIEQTTILVILLTTPLASITLTFLTPKLLTKTEQPQETGGSPETSKSSKKRLSGMRFQETVAPNRRKSIRRSSYRERNIDENNPG